jgi:ABC-type bacteriocin/lantibiotic exporter with double-glycine peptidase domain
LDVLPPFLGAAATALILLAGTRRVMQGEMSIGTMIAFQTLMTSFLSPVGLLVQFGGTFQELRGDLGRLDDVLENKAGDRLEVDEVAPSAGSPPTRLAGRVEFQDLKFGYNPLEPPTIEGFSAEVAPGNWLGIVGPSGSGKSTVAKLLSGLHRAWSGAIRFDGLPRDRIRGTVLVNSVGVVDQDLLLFEGTVRENLTLWDPTISDDSLVRACRDALIHDDIMSLPGGYGALLLEGGINLSGGQRQRLEIARALVRDPTVLILDEATSALDAETEHQINQNIRRRDCTCVVVAHRLSTIHVCDEIVMLDRGRIVERGSHDVLLASQGAYARLITSTPS